MKNSIGVIIWCLLLCVGCTSIGSFEKGTLELVNVYKDVLKEINDENWNMGVMQEISLDASMVEVTYGLKPNDIQDFVVYQSVIPADCGEIAIFHIKDNDKEVIYTGINKRIVEMKNTAALLPSQLAIIEGNQIIEVGEYIVFVSGVDAQKVIQYISSL